MSDESPGWQAIDDALHPLYGDQEPRHYGTIISYSLGGQDPLDGVSIYRNDQRQNSLVTHWHYVTYGFSELYTKESENAECSGWGFELTFRLVCADEAEPPIWPVSFLQNLARYVFTSGNVFQAGHHLDLNGPIALEEDTLIRAVVFAEDPQLPARDTPNGKVEFLQVVGITPEELQAVMAWNTRSFLTLMAATNPLLLTDLRRPSLLASAEMAAAIEEGIRRDGSSTHGLYVSDLAWQRLPGGQMRLELSANSVERICRLLPARLPHGSDFWLWGPQQSVQFRPPEAVAEQEEGAISLALSPEQVQALSTTLLPQRGEYQVPGLDGLTVRVVPTMIRDAGGEVVETIG